MDFFTTISEIKDISPELDASTPIFSLERSFAIARSKITEIIGQDVYQVLKSDITKLPEALSALKSSLVNFMMNEHIVFSEAAKVKEKKMFKYEYDQVRGKYIDYGYVYLDVLINELELSALPEWNNSEQKQSIGKLLITASDLRELGGIDSKYFYFRTRNIIRDIADDEISPRYTKEKIDSMDERTLRLLKRATVYFVLSRVIREFDYGELPRPLRSSLQSEFSGGNSFDKDDLSRIAETYKSRAVDVLSRLEIKTKILNTPSDALPLTPGDKFYISNTH